MKTFRIGETLDISWAIKTPNGNPYRLIGANVSLYVSVGHSTLEIPAFSCVDGVVRFTFEGVEQRRSGAYTLTLFENEARNNQVIIEECAAFQLSDCSVEIDDGNSVEIDTIVNISQTIPEIQAKELERIKNEKARIAAENERVSAEKSRASAEELRTSSERARITDEALRKTSEQSRRTAEQSRSSAESERKTNESARVSAESARTAAELSRRSAEQSRQSAESARAAAEQSRVQEFQTLKHESQAATADANQAAYNTAQARADISRLSSLQPAEDDGSALPLLCGQPPILFAAGTPKESVVPDNWRQFDQETGEGYNWTGLPSAIGQQYINTEASGGGRYIGVRDGMTALKWLNC